MITGALSNFPGTEDDEALMTWCEKVHGQHSGDIPTTVKRVLDHQDTAEALGTEIRVIREALREICNAREIMPTAIGLRKALLKTTDTELRKQSKNVSVTLKAQVQQCLVRYVDTLSCALAIAQKKEEPEGEPPRPGEYMNVDASSISLRDGEPAGTDEAAINKWLTSETGTDEELVTDEDDGPDSGELLL